MAKPCGIHVAEQNFVIQYDYDGFPSDIIYEYAASYTGSPLLKINIERPDGKNIMLYADSLPYSSDMVHHTERIFSTDPSIKSNLQTYSDFFMFSLYGIASESIVFSKADMYEPLHGTYKITASLYGAPDAAHITESTLILGGRAYGLLGTDDLRRDLAIGIAFHCIPILFAQTLHGQDAWYWRQYVWNGSKLRIWCKPSNKIRLSCMWKSTQGKRMSKMWL